MKLMMSAILMVLVSTGCASMRSKFERVEPGQSRADIIDNLGNPVEFTKSAEDGADLLVWRADDYTYCAVAFHDNKAVRKACKMDGAALARDNAIRAQQASLYMQMQQMKPQQSSYAPVRGYQPSQPIQSNCTRTGYNTVNCVSQPTGVDTSIYNQ